MMARGKCDSPNSDSNDAKETHESVQLEGGTRTVMSASSNAQWVDPDVVVFAREGVLMGQRVNVEAARPRRRSRSR